MFSCRGFSFREFSCLAEGLAVEGLAEGLAVEVFSCIGLCWIAGEGLAGEV